MNYKKILLITIFVAILAAVLFFSVRYSIEKEMKASLEIQKNSQRFIEEIVGARVLYIINKGEGEILQYNITPYPGSTVFSLLDELSKREDFEMSYKMYSEMGVFVESIDGVKNGTDGKYWQYWVNNELPMVAADNLQVQGGDTVEWKFETIEF